MVQEGRNGSYYAGDRVQVALDGCGSCSDQDDVRTASPAELSLACAGGQGGGLLGDGGSTAARGARDEGPVEAGEKQQHEDRPSAGNASELGVNAEAAEDEEGEDGGGGGVEDGRRGAGGNGEPGVSTAVGWLGMSKDMSEDEYDVVHFLACSACCSRAQVGAEAACYRHCGTGADEVEFHAREGDTRAERGASAEAARMAADASVYLELSALKDELVLLRRAANVKAYQFNLPQRVAAAEKQVAERNAKLLELQAQIAASEKNETLAKRRLSSITNQMEQHGD
eukprot:2577455-Pleurochrysis_carterae.AAC.1